MAASAPTSRGAMPYDAAGGPGAGAGGRGPGWTRSSRGGPAPGSCRGPAGTGPGRFEGGSLTATTSQDDVLPVLAVDVAERVGDLAQRRLRLHRGEEEGHEVLVP